MYNCGVYILVLRGPLGLLVLIVEEEDTPDPKNKNCRGWKANVWMKMRSRIAVKGVPFLGKVMNPFS